MYNFKIPKPPDLKVTTKLNEEHKTIELKQQHYHDYKVALFSIIGGGIMGLITSTIFWLITK